MDNGPLVREEIEAGEQLIREFAQYKPVAVAFWLKESDNPHRYLYLSSEEINEADIPDAYRQIIRMTNEHPSPDLDPFRIKVISSQNRFARAATEIHERYPARIPTRIGGSLFGGVSVDDVYIYPPLVPAITPS